MKTSEVSLLPLGEEHSRAISQGGRNHCDQFGAMRCSYAGMGGKNSANKENLKGL
jgi:hypothetical protein